MARGLVVFGEAAAGRRGAHVFAEDSRGGVDRVSRIVDRGRLSGVRGHGVAFPQRRPVAGAARAAADVGNLHRPGTPSGVGAGAIAVAALLRTDRREEAPVDVEPRARPLVEPQPFRRDALYRVSGRGGSTRRERRFAARLTSREARSEDSHGHTEDREKSDPRNSDAAQEPHPQRPASLAGSLLSHHAPSSPLTSSRPPRGARSSPIE